MIRSIPEIFAKRAFTYLLKRFFGQYLETFAYEELSLTFNKGKGIVENVRLKVEALNSLSEDYNLPVEFLHGSIEMISFEIPWTAPFTANSVIEFQGVHLVVQPKKCAEDVSMFGSMWESMTSSLQLAEECLMFRLENETEFDPSQPAESVEIMMQAINTVLSKMQIRLINTRIVIESLLQNGNSGVALEMRIKSCNCYDEASDSNYPASNLTSDYATYQPATFSVKKITFEGVKLYTYQFSTSAHRLRNAYVSTELTAGSPEMPPTHLPTNIQKQQDDVLLKDPILISKINGQQQIIFKMKQNESIMGPKVNIGINLGAINLFLTPFQVHLMIELMNGLTVPGPTQNNTGKIYPPTVSNRPMKQEDFALIEQELQRQQKHNLPSKSLKNKQGWSTHPLGGQEEFHLMTMENLIAASVQQPIVPEELETSCSSVGSETIHAKRTTLQNALLDPMSELTHITASCSSLCVLILHDNVSAEKSNIDIGVLNWRGPLNVSTLKSRAEKYFDDLMNLVMEGLNFGDFQSVRDKISKICHSDHLRFMANSITFEAYEKSSSSQRQFSTTLNLLNLQVLECLFNISKSETLLIKPVYMEIVTFQHPSLDSALEKISATDGTEPCFRMKYDQFDYGTNLRAVRHPVNKLSITLAPVLFEVDISITDRIRTLLNADPLFNNTEARKDPFMYSWTDQSNHLSQNTEIMLNSSFVLVKLRFPVPDFRSIHDMERDPWWKQNLREEYLILEMFDASVFLLLDQDQSRQEIQLQCRDLHGLFQMSPNEEPQSFLRIAVDPEAEKSSQENGFDWPRLVVYVNYEKTSNLLDTESEDVFPVSITDTLINNIDKAPSPFSANSVLYSTMFSERNNSNGGKSICEDNEIIKPAKKENTLQFIHQTINRSYYVFDFHLPTVNIVLPDKHFFEMLYNRVLSDLVLWENTPLNKVFNQEPCGFKIHISALSDMKTLGNEDSFHTFQQYPSNDVHTDSNTESDEENGIYYSVNEHYLKHKEKQKKIHNSNGFTKLSISLNIDKGSLLFRTPLRDENKSIVPGHCGQLNLCVGDAKLFIASSYNGDPHQSYLCLLSNKATVYHDSESLLPIERHTVKPYVESASKNSTAIIYCSEKGVPLNANLEGSSDTLNALSLAVHITKDVKQQLKTFKIALGVCGSTLRHHMTSLAQLWLHQFIDFIDVNDYPLFGYTPSDIIIELHLHLENCAIDYRPLYLPLRSMLLVENFSLSTNITASTNTSLLRIISEELCLLISNNTSAQSVDLKKNYVCVIDTGLIGLSINFTSATKDTESKFEMCASNNMIHVRTCADSCQALQQLILYLACNGDFKVENPTCKDSPVNTEQNCTINKDVNSSPVLVGENVHNLMVEAMRDCTGNMEDKKHSDSDWSTDDEFCILELEPGIGRIPQLSDPLSRVLTNAPIRIFDAHFPIPSTKSDLLKAPKHFPKPVVSQTLKEMSITWHLYGGNDFNKSKSHEKKRVRIRKDSKESPSSEDNYIDDNQNIKIDAGNSTICFSKVTPLSDDYNSHTFHYSLEPLNLNERDVNPRLWMARGGQNRNTDVLIEMQMNKVRFRHDVYPENSEYASRNILLVHDIEIKDRLASSEFNKLLYQYTSESMPRQTHANMVVVKAVSVRPDPNHENEECSLKVSCKPLRLNIDQDTLMFLFEFCKDFVEVVSEESEQRAVNLNDAKNHVKITENVDATNLLSALQMNKEPKLTFFRSFSFSPDVPIRIDYRGKRVMMDQGALQGIFLGLAHLDCSEIKLKRLSYKHGLLGIEKLLSYAGNEWAQDIKKNQLPSILGGIGPMHSFVQLFQGFKDLVWLPVEQYRKDGQIVRGLQKGVSSFSTSTASAFLELASRVVCAIQGAAEVVYDLLSPGPNNMPGMLPRTSSQCNRINQPADIREGMTTAYNVIKEGLGDTAKTIAQVATVEHEHKGVRGAVGGVLRQIPPAAVTPIILGTEAAYALLGGVKHQLVPDAHKEAMDKWRTKK